MQITPCTRSIAGHAYTRAGIGLVDTVDGQNHSQSHQLICRIGNIQLVAVAPGHPFLSDGYNGQAAPGDLIFMGQEAACDLPAETVNAVSGKQEGKFLFDLQSRTGKRMEL